MDDLPSYREDLLKVYTEGLKQGMTHREALEMCLRELDFDESTPPADIELVRNMTINLINDYRRQH